MTHKFSRLPLIALLALSLAGCATVPTDPEERKAYDETNDPIEPFNRAMFDVNIFLDRLILRPMALIYRGVVPDFLRDRVHNVLANLNEPINLLNTALQGRFDDSGQTIGRFLTNTTVGGLGVFDVATDWGMPETHGDFGQTLYAWGWTDSSYLVLPLLGPSSTRDGIGVVGDAFADPWPYVLQANGGHDARWTYLYITIPAKVLDRRTASLDSIAELERSSFDLYAAMRSAYRQYRAQEIKSGKSGEAYEEGYGGYGG